MSTRRHREAGRIKEELLSNNSLQNDDLKKQVITSLAWLGGMKYLGQIVSWAITILIIRILNPGDYGLMAMASVCINFLVMIGELGLGAAIVQKKELSRRQQSHIFGFVIVSHGIMFLILFFGSPLIAGYFSEPRLIPILQVLSLNFLFLAMYIIPHSVLMRKMDFKLKSLVELAATVFSSVLSLILALRGYGVWSLVWASVCIHVTLMIGYNAVVRDFFLPGFGLEEIREFISFGLYSFASRILWYFYSKADVVIAGPMIGNTLLGIYSVTLELSQIPMDKFMPIVNQVAFPAFSRIQSDLTLVGSHFLKAVRIGSLILFPVFWGLLAVAPEFLGLLLGDKWKDVIFPLQLMCLVMPLRTLGTLVSPMLYGIGRVDVNLWYVSVAAVFMPLSFFAGVSYYGVTGLCLAWVFGYSFVFFVTLKFSLRLLNLSLTEFLSNMFFPFSGTCVMMSVIFGCKHLIHHLFPLPLTVCILITAGICSYGLFIFWVKKAAFDEAWALIPGHGKIETFIKNIFIFNRR